MIILLPTQHALEFHPVLLIRPCSCPGRTPVPSSVQQSARGPLKKMSVNEKEKKKRVTSAVTAPIPPPTTSATPPNRFLMTANWKVKNTDRYLWFQLSRIFSSRRTRGHSSAPAHTLAPVVQDPTRSEYRALQILDPGPDPERLRLMIGMCFL